MYWRGFRPFVSIRAAALFTCVTAGVAFGQSPQQVVLSPLQGDKFKTTSGDLEGDLNCDEVRFHGSEVVGIVQNIPDFGPAYGGEMRRLGKLLVNEVLLRPENVLHDYLVQGRLHGVEFDWFFPNGNQAPTEARLPGAVEVFAPAGEEAVLVARIFGYDAAQYADRKAAVEKMIGHPMRTYDVWLGDVLVAAALAPVEERALSITGRANAFFGGLAAAGAFELYAPGNLFVDELALAGELVAAGSRELPDVLRLDDVEPLSVSFSEDAARGIARRQGTYVAGDLSIHDTASTPPAGIVFAEGSITIARDGLAGVWTFVSASGEISLRGDRALVRPWLGQVAAVAFDGDVSLRGEKNRLVGQVLAPRGLLEVSGARNTLVGGLAGAGARISGSENLVSDGTHPIPIP